jgi:putative peptidoglycan lipid II flippase
MVRAVLGATLAILSVATALGIAFAPWIVWAMAPGFARDPGQHGLASLLTRVMFPFLLFISLAALVMGALNVRRIFFIPALAPAMLNVTIIAAVFALATRMQQPIIAVAIGVALGGFVQFAFQVPAFYKNNYALKPRIVSPGWKHHLSLLFHETYSVPHRHIRGCDGHGCSAGPFRTCGERRP